MRSPGPSCSFFSFLLGLTAIPSTISGQGLFDLQPSGPEMEINKEGLDWDRIAERVRRHDVSQLSPVDPVAIPGIGSLIYS
jgi:hypothetical protein